MDSSALDLTPAGTATGDLATRDLATRDLEGRFAKGNPGGPGRPRGSRNKAGRRLDERAAADADEILDRMIKLALEGNQRAAEFVLSRLWPRHSGNGSEFELPTIANPEDLPAALGALAEALGRGEITAGEAKMAARLLNERCEALLRFSAIEVPYRCVQEGGVGDPGGERNETGGGERLDPAK